MPSVCGGVAFIGLGDCTTGTSGDRKTTLVSRLLSLLFYWDAAGTSRRTTVRARTAVAVIVVDIVHHVHPAGTHQSVQASAIGFGRPVVGPHVVRTAAATTAVVIGVHRIVPLTAAVPVIFSGQAVLHRVHDHVSVHRAAVTKVLEQHARDQRLQEFDGRCRIFQRWCHGRRTARSQRDRRGGVHRL